MKKLLPLFFLLICSCSLFAQQKFQLAPPLLKYSSIFFAGKTSLEIKFAQKGTSVHYSLNNEEPTEQDPVYLGPITISKNFTTVKAKAFGDSFLPSPTAVVTFIKEGIKIKSIDYTVPDSKYPGSGVTTLIDNKGGIDQAGSKTWFGYHSDTVSIILDLGKEQMVEDVLVNFLQSEGSWIFLPQQILVYSFNKKTNSFSPFGKDVLFMEEQTPGTKCNYQIIHGRYKTKTRKILISFWPVKKIPDWHPAKGEHGWMFIDEIKIY